MVWCLSPLDSSSGSRAYYFFSTGIYTIGRKGCHVTIQSDVGVSREHARLIVTSMASECSVQDGEASFATEVCIEDCSKFGTYVNKKPGSAKVKELPNRRMDLRNGDMLFFGATTFRFHYLSLTFFMHGTKSRKATRPLEEAILSIGATLTHKWDVDCTHVVADECSPITSNVVEAIAARKPIVSASWIKALPKNTSLEFPSYITYGLSMKLEGSIVKIVEPEARDRCLDRYIFVLGSPKQYMFGEALPALLKVCGAGILSIDEFCMDSQRVPGKVSNQFVLVCPDGGDNFDHSHLLSSISKIDENKVVAAALSGHLDLAAIQSSPIVLSPSGSTNETVVPDSDVEQDTAVSACNVIEDEKMEVLHDNETETLQKLTAANIFVEYKGRSQEECKSETRGCHNSDIIYSKDLIVKSFAGSTVFRSRLKQNEVNFKSFRKKEVPSGNSFKNLIPFSKDPYM